MVFLAWEFLLLFPKLWIVPIQHVYKLVYMERTTLKRDDFNTYNVCISLTTLYTTDESYNR